MRFFPKSAYAAVSAKRTPPLVAARKQWEPQSDVADAPPSDGEDAYNALAFRGIDPIDDAFLALAHRVFDPLCAHQVDEKA